MDKSSVSLLLVIVGIMVVTYYLFAIKSMVNRGEVTQSYWYCDVFMDNKEHGVQFPHHRGRRPLIPFSDHLCGDRELDLARDHGWEE